MTKIGILFLILLAASGGCGSMQVHADYPISDHFDGKHFFNPWGVNNSKSLWDVLKWKWTTTAKAWPEAITNTATPRLVRDGQSASVHVTAIGHATTYLQDESRSILTDPQFSDRASPVSFAGPRRARKPALKIEELPRVDLVLVSHNHYDHLDLPSLRELDHRHHPKFVVPLGNGRLLKDAGIREVIELDWWQKFENVQLVPAQHWSARGMADRNEALWGGYVIELSGKKIFFAGDTGYGPHFKMIRERLGPMDLSLLPIGAYEPRWFMKDQHMNPDDAVLAHLDLESKQSFAIHFETLQLTDEGFDEPRTELAKSLAARKVARDRFFAPQVGETLILH